MPWCPKCELEYVDGIKICPDCKSTLVSSLENKENNEADIPMDLNYGAIISSVEPEVDQSIIEEERAAILENLRMAASIPKYDSIEEKYTENKSGAGVLIVAGAAGLCAIVLNMLGVFNFPMQGFSLVLTYLVMGCLFFVFLASGIRSVIKTKQLKPELEKEQKAIEDAINFIKQRKADGMYSVDKNTQALELAYIEMSNQVIADLNGRFTDMPEGFAQFVCDRYLGEILDED